MHHQSANLPPPNYWPKERQIVNKNMLGDKKIIFFLILTSLLLSPVALIATDSQNLGDLLNQTGTAAGYNVALGNEDTGLARLAGTIARFFISLIGIIFISYTIYGGYLWLTSGGNEERITKAKSIIKNGVIGLVVILAAAAIYLVITNALISPRAGIPSAP